MQLGNLIWYSSSGVPKTSTDNETTGTPLRNRLGRHGMKNDRIDGKESLSEARIQSLGVNSFLG